jgi:hypothetical protein
MLDASWLLIPRVNMRMKLNVTALCLLVFCFSNILQAQEKPDLFSKIERTFKQEEPAWKVESTLPSNTWDPRTQSIVFHRGKIQASIEISIWRREIDAKDVFAATSLSFDNTAGKKMAKRILPKVGDENHIWTSRGSTPWTTIKFRNGNINVEVFAPSVMIAKRFARHILEQMAAS